MSVFCDISFGNKYISTEICSSGEFSTVYKGKNIITEEIVAIKYEDNTQDIRLLKNEAKIYQYLGKQSGFCTLKYFGTNKNGQYMITDLLGQSISSMQYKKTMNIEYVSEVGIKILDHIETLHNNKILHRDIKPDNILFGYPPNDDKLFLIDLGISKCYMNGETHMSPRLISSIIGTPNFVSLNVHNRIEPSRRDDIESWIYVLIYLYMGHLPWDNQCEYDMIMNKQTIVDNISLPNKFKLLLLYVHNMDFDECPDYLQFARILKIL